MLTLAHRPGCGTKWMPRGIISATRDVFKNSHADVNFPKIHLMSHWVKQICWYGALQRYSAKRHEQVHKMHLNNGWNTSNHILDDLPQVIIIQRRILCFKIRNLDLQALAQCWERSAATWNVITSGADLPAPLSSQSFAKSKFIGFQYRHNGSQPDAMIKNFRALLDNTQHATHLVTIYDGTWEFIKHKSRNKMYISDNALHAIELWIYHGIMVQAMGIEGECISHICWCTES